MQDPYWGLSSCSRIKLSSNSNIIVQNHNQDSDIDTVHLLFKTSSVLLILVCVCVSTHLYDFIMCRLMYPPPQSRQKRIKDLLCCLYNHIHLPFPSYPEPLATSDLFSFSISFSFLRMLYKWTLSVCNLWGLAFFSQGNPLQIDPGCSVYQYLVLLIAE